MISPSGPFQTGTPESTNPKVIEEIVLDDSGNEMSEPNEKSIAKEEMISLNAKSPRRGISLLKTSSLRGLLPPTTHSSYQEIQDLPVVKRCCIEHSYFVRNRSGMSRYNFRPLPAHSGATLPFENEDADEQPTVAFGCLAPKHNSVVADDLFYKNNVNGKRNSRSRRDSSTDDSNDRDYCRVESSTDSDSDSPSVVSVESVGVIPRSEVVRDADGSADGFGLNANRSSVGFFGFHGTSTDDREMQKLTKSKCANEKGKTGKGSPPRLKKISAQKKDDSILKMTEYLYPALNLNKVSQKGDNWRMEYLDDEIQSLGLDDLLLKASELNAENFTKALGRKVEPVKTGFNSKDSSEIVFTIPKSKKKAEEVGEGDGELSKRMNLKTIKLDISKPFFESEKAKEAEPAGKPQEEASPKRTGIKVKTVQNINEEFKDSLGRLNGMEDACSGLDKTNFDVRNDGSEVLREALEAPEKDSDGGRPFIMTIIQSKTEKQRPAILRNSYLKRKAALEMEKAQSAEGEPPPGGSLKKDEKPEDGTDIPGGSLLEKGTEGFIPFEKAFEELESDSSKGQEELFPVKKKNIPFILNRNRKSRKEASSANGSKLVKGGEKVPTGEKTFKITSIEQKLGPKEASNRRFIKLVPYEPLNKQGQGAKGAELPKKASDDEVESQQDGKVPHILSLSSFSIMLKEILPDKWSLTLDKKHGLQIIKTHLDEYLNPSILISVVIARCGKVAVNVRGKQLSKSHELFSNLCNMTNSENKLSLNYVMGIMNKLRHRSVCCGCDNPALKKYWSDGGVVETQTEFQQVYRSHFCQLLVPLGRRRCYPCYRINESLKKRHRKDKLSQKSAEGEEKEQTTFGGDLEEPAKSPPPPTRGVKRHLEDFLEESFSTMKQQIEDEIEKNKVLGERENALKAQEEVLSFMGLTRKESLDNPVRKSKRKKNSFFKLQQPVKKKIDQKELEFLEKYWSDINTLFSTSLLFGAYSRTGRGRLREKCKMFQKLLSTWKKIVSTNPEWIGELPFLKDHNDGENLENLSSDEFDKMDSPALRAYIINSVKEVNRLKHKLRTRNSYFKVLYNKFVKRRMKRSKALGSNGGGSATSTTTNTPTPTDFSSDENSRDKEKAAGEGEGVEGAGGAPEGLNA